MKTSQFKRTSLFESLGIEKDAYFETWERDIHPVLCEVALSAEQIDKLFKDIDQAKGNRTALGKGIDATKAAADKISDVWYNKFGAMLQNSAPVQAFDKSYDDMKAKIRAANPDSKIIAAIDKYGEYAKQHPNMQKFILGIVGSLAAALGIAAAGGVAAGALAVGTGTGVAVGIVNIADRLLKGGEKLSTSLGRGATAGITAGLTAAAVTKVAGLINDTLANIQRGREVHVITINPGTPIEQRFHLLPADSRAYDKFGQKWLDAIHAPSGGFDGLMDPNSASNSAMTAASKAMAEILDKASDPAYQQAAIDLAQKAGEATAPLKQAIQGITALQQAITPVASALAGQAAGNAQPAQQPAQAESRNLSRKQVLALFERVERINNKMLSEGRLFEAAKPKQQPTQPANTAQPAPAAVQQPTAAPGQTPAQPKQGLMGKVGSALGKGLGAVGKGLGKVGHAMTTKVTGSALQKAWEKAGSPTDSVAIEKLLQAQGVNYEVINTVFQANKIPVTIKPTAAQGQTPAVFTPGGNRQGGTTSTPAGATPSALGQSPATPTAAPAAGQPATPTGSPAPQAIGTTSAAPQAAQPAQSAPAPITAVDIKKAIPNMKVGELRGIKKSIDYILDIQDKKKAAGKKPKATPAPKATKKPTAQTSQDATKAALKSRQASGIGAYEDFKRAVSDTKKML